MFTSGFVALLTESADQLFKYVTHLKVADLIWMKIRLSKLLNHQIQQVVFVQPNNLVIDLESIYENLSGIVTETVDHIGQVRSDIVRVIQQLLKSEFAGVVKAVPRRHVQHGFTHGIVHVLGQILHLLENLVLCGGKNTVQTAQDGEWQNNLAVVGLFVVPTQKFCYGPDERDLLAVVGHFLVPWIGGQLSID